MTSSSKDACAADISAVHWEMRITEARDGNREAQGELFHRLSAYLRSRAMEQLDSQLKVKTSPSDIVQETLLEAHRVFSSFQGQTRAQLLHWMQGILNHRVKTAYRRFRGTGKRNLAKEASFRLPEVADSELHWLAALSGTPSEHAVMNEELAQLDKALRRLAPRQEQVIRLRNELKLSFDEVGLALECSANAAQKLWTRAINELTQLMQSDASDR